MGRTWRKLLSPILGNFSVQYNIQSATLALAILVSNEQGKELAPEPEWADYFLKGDVFIGASVGMMVMGVLGDYLGRQRALIITHLCTTVGAFGSLFGSMDIKPGGNVHDFSDEALYLNMAICRALLGFGVGGVYPLSATSAAESATTAEQSVEHAAFVFLWQAVGSAAPYLVGCVFADFPFNALWRVVVGLGAVPAAACVYLSCGVPESESFVNARSGNSANDGCFTGLKKLFRENARLLTGTAGSWLLFDIAYYGTVLNTPTFLKSIFGKHLHLRSLCALNFFVLMLQVPAQLLTTWALGPKKRSLRDVQLIGFCMFAVAFSAFAAVVHWLGSAFQFAALLVMILVLGFGPNVTTYVLPTQCYGAQIRSSAHGLSSAAGKLGAILGTVVFPAIMAVGRLEHVASVQAVVSLVGVLVTYAFVPRPGVAGGGNGVRAELLPAA